MKRPTALLLVVLANGCGGGGAPPEAPVAPEAKPAAAPAPASTAPETPAATASAAPTPTTAPSAAPTLVVSMTAGAPPPPPPAAVGEEGPPPPVSTTQRGLLHAQLLGTEIVFITVADASVTCANLATKPSKGDRRIEVRVPWKTGLYDQSSTARFDQYQTTFWTKIPATQSSVRVRGAPLEPGTTGRIHVKAQRPGESADVELDVSVCTAVDLTPPKKPKK